MMTSFVLSREVTNIYNMKRVLSSILVFLALLPVVVVAENVEFTIDYGVAPFLDVDIINNPVYTDPDTTILLTSLVDNVGSAQATDVYLGWQLPANWKVSLGSETVHYNALQVGERGWNIIMAYVVSGVGSFQVSALANGSQGLSGSDTVTIWVGEQPPEQTGEEPGTGEPGGPSVEVEKLDQPGPEGQTNLLTITIGNAAFSYFIEDTNIEIPEFGTYATYVEVTNIGDVDLTDATVRISGLEKEWFTIEPREIPLIPPNETVRFNIVFEPFDSGTYNFEIKIFAGPESNTVAGTMRVTPIEKFTKIRKERSRFTQDKFEKIMQLVLLFGVVSPSIIAGQMLLALYKKRCPICGKKMMIEEQGGKIVRSCETCDFSLTAEDKVGKAKNKKPDTEQGRKKDEDGKAPKKKSLSDFGDVKVRRLKKRR